MTVTRRSIEKDFRKLGDPAIAEHSKGFFKTGKGEYGEGDVFVGVRIPVIRAAVKNLREASLTELEDILGSKYHEIRMLALLCLVDHYHRGNEEKRKAIAARYLASTAHINNWDLVDCSAHKILGPHLENRSRKILYTFARSKDLWKRRIAIMTTFHFIRFSGNKDFDDALNIAQILLQDSEDLIHKAVGWMLREIGKQDKSVEDKFLIAHYKVMPRTMLRYAIEKYPEQERQAFLKGEA